MAVETLFRSRDYPSADVFGQWCEVVNRVLMPSRVTAQRPETFSADLRLLTLGAVQVTSLRHTPLIATRDPVHVRRADPGLYCLSFTLRGTMLIDCRREQSTATPGGWILFDTWHSGRITKLDPPGGKEWDPGRGQLAATGCNARGHAHLMLHLPRDFLPLPDRIIDPLLGHSLPPAGATGALLARLLTGAFARGDEFDHGEAAHVGQAAAELAAALLARACRRDDALAPQIRARDLVGRITAFIERHLTDPTLSPATVAAAHHISVRYLQRLLKDAGTSPAALIRRRRLEHCRAELAAPQPHERPAYEIGARWGFTDATDFSRAFRSMYGMPPGEYRASRRVNARDDDPER